VSVTVSHIMPVWQPNHDWLQQAVRSALEQDALHELILVDDGNPVPVADLLRDVTDPRLAVIRVPHGGTGAARNAGIARATGQMFRFIDADDVLEPGSSGSLLRLSGDDGAIAFGSTLVCDPEMRPVRLIESRLEGNVVVNCLLGQFDCRLFSIVFPRHVVEKTGGFDPTLKHNEDWDYVLRAVEHARVRGEPAVATRYRRHDASATARTESSFASNQRIVSKYFERHPEQRGTRLERDAHTRLYLVDADGLLFRRRYRAFTRALASAARRDPRAAAPRAAGALRQIARAIVSRLRLQLRNARSS
jgi:glycosyltransferase involved in cell wall biosynthesis